MLAMVSLLGGCIGHGQWGAHTDWPSGAHVGRSAIKAAKDPQVWVPMVTAGLLVAADVDHQWSEDIAEGEFFFDGDGESQSNHLRDVASGAYVLTALVAPSETLADKVSGAAVGVGAATLDGMVSRGLKNTFSRERPDGSNDNSMPSGHASKASVRSAMAQYNLRYIDMPMWSYQLANWSLHGVAVGTGLARVEARKHHLSDVFVGYAVGQFIASFMYEAFFEGEHGARLTFAPVEDGGALTLTVPLH